MYVFSSNGLSGSKRTHFSICFNRFYYWLINKICRDDSNHTFKSHSSNSYSTYIITVPLCSLIIMVHNSAAILSHTQLFPLFKFISENIFPVKGVIYKTATAFRVFLLPRDKKDITLLFAFAK